MSDQFFKNMTDYLQDALKTTVAEVDRLRRENAQLLKDLNTVPVEMWELQERVTELEMRLRSLGVDLGTLPPLAAQSESKEG